MEPPETPNADPTLSPPWSFSELLDFNLYISDDLNGALHEASGGSILYYILRYYHTSGGERNNNFVICYVLVSDVLFLSWFVQLLMI